MSNHVVKIPLRGLEEYEKRSIDKRLYAHALLYNATLGSLLNKIHIYHEELDKINKHSKVSWKRKNKLKRKYGLSKFETIQLGHEYKRNTGNALLDGLTVNQTASRAWTAAEDYLKYKKNKPNLKRPEDLNCVQGSGIKQNLRLIFLKESYGKNQQIDKWLSISLSDVKSAYDLNRVILNWSGRDTPKRKHLHLRIDWLKLPQVRRNYLIKLLQNNQLIQAGVKRELVRGKLKYYILLTFKGNPYRKSLIKQPEGTLAIDTGPAQSKGVDSQGKTYHYQTSKESLNRFQVIEEKIKRKQRALERSLRVNNPECYQENGVLKKGARLKKWSRNAYSLKKDLHELHRKRRVLQKENTLKQVKKISQEHKTVILENVSYRAWFTRYSKSMKIFTPGLFQSLLEQELKLRDGKLVKLPLAYAFSQSCYCSNKIKKPLSQREHTCQTSNCITNGKTYNRDLFSASLMLTVHENNLDKKTYQSTDWFAGLSPKARTTIETRLGSISNTSLNANDHPSSTLPGKLIRDKKTQPTLDNKKSK